MIYKLVCLQVSIVGNFKSKWKDYPKDIRFVRITDPNVYSQNLYDLDKVRKTETIILK